MRRQKPPQPQPQPHPRPCSSTFIILFFIRNILNHDLLVAVREMRKMRDSAAAAAAAAPTASLLLFFMFLFVLHIDLSSKWAFYNSIPNTTGGDNGLFAGLVSDACNEKEIRKELFLSTWDHILNTCFINACSREIQGCGGSHGAAQIHCDRSHRQYDTCTINATTVLDPTTTTFFVVGPTLDVVEKIRPYPRKWEAPVMSRIKEVSLTSGPPSPSCQVHHTAPALVFSAGGYTGNVFHDFSDGFIPLFITVRSMFPDRNFVIVVQKCRRWWESKYKDLLRSLSEHPIVNLEEANSTHCFPYVHVGLISHGFMTINPTLTATSMNLTHFRLFLDSAYAENHPPPIPSTARPRLVVVARSGGVGRRILNQDDLCNAAREVGFHVTIFHPTGATSLREAYALINSSHAMIGVHGAALTHMLFLRRGSTFMQVVPLGLGWAAEACYGNAANELGLEYLEYKIGVEESSLAEKYGKDDVMVKDPEGVKGKDWFTKIMKVYLKEQNVKLDLVRFRRYLEEAYDKAITFMQKEG